MDIPAYLENYKAVLKAFGSWPSFHDAEVRSILLDRNQVIMGELANPRLELVVHAHELSSGANASGVFELSKHHLCTFEFEMVHEVALKNFNPQNALRALLFQPLPADSAGHHPFRVVLDAPSDPSAPALHGSFIAFRGKVRSVVPCTETGRAI